MDMRVVAVDPGRKGGVAEVYRRDAGFEAGRIMSLPWMGAGERAEPDIAALVDWVKDVRPAPALVLVEGVPFVKQNMTDFKRVYPALKQFRYFGEILGGFKAAKFRTQVVYPQSWQKRLLGTPDLPAAREERKKRLKQLVIGWCRQNYPDTKLYPEKCRTPQDGWSDALAIAHWGAAYALTLDRPVSARRRAKTPAADEVSALIDRALRQQIDITSLGVNLPFGERVS